MNSKEEVNNKLNRIMSNWLPIYYKKMEHKSIFKIFDKNKESKIERNKNFKTDNFV